MNSMWSASERPIRFAAARDCERNRANSQWLAASYLIQDLRNSAFFVEIPVSISAGLEGEQSKVRQ